MPRTCFALALAAALGATALTASTASAQVLYQTGTPTGYFTPFSSASPAGIKYGDSGWFGSGSSAPATVGEITLVLCTFSSTSAPAGSTDIKFTFNNGDPSGLVFGPGNALYSTTVTNVTLPASDSSGPSYFSLTIPMTGVTTAGGFNNIGWSVGVENFNYAGQFGFGNRGNSNDIGFYTNNASFYNGTSWSLFAFGPNSPADIGNFVVQVAVPEPTSIAALAGIAVVALRRRARA